MLLHFHTYYTQILWRHLTSIYYFKAQVCKVKSVGWFFKYSGTCALLKAKINSVEKGFLLKRFISKGINEGIGVWRDSLLTGLIVRNVFFALQATTPYMAWKFGWPDVCHPICSMSICQPPFLSLCLGWAFLFPLMWFLPESSFWSPYVWLSSTPSIT